MYAGVPAAFWRLEPKTAALKTAIDHYVWDDRPPDTVYRKLRMILKPPPKKGGGGGYPPEWLRAVFKWLGANADQLKRKNLLSWLGVRGAAFAHHRLYDENFREVERQARALVWEDEGQEALLAYAKKLHLYPVQRLSFSSEALDTFAKVVETGKTVGDRVAILVLPVPSRFRQRGADREALRQVCSSLARRTGASLVDLYDMDVDDTDFFDADHMTLKGGIKVTEALADAMASWF
jgi:hypothetical protein